MRYFLYHILAAAGIFAHDLIDTSSGPVIGFSPVSGVTAYLGIPFAAPPVGQLRFEPPQPPKRHKHPIHAIAYSPSCVQYKYKHFLALRYPEILPESEDCLYLNIWVPSRRTTARGNARNKGKGGLPSLVWLHGGGFGEGSGTSERQCCFHQ
jgi:para-nitrobenzyl esterase